MITMPVNMDDVIDSLLSSKPVGVSLSASQGLYFHPLGFAWEFVPHWFRTLNHETGSGCYVVPALLKAGERTRDVLGLAFPHFPHVQTVHISRCPLIIIPLPQMEAAAPF